MKKPKQTLMYFGVMILILSTMVLGACGDTPTPPTDTTSTDINATPTDTTNTNPTDSTDINTTPASPDSSVTPPNNTNQNNLVTFVCDNDKNIKATFMNTDTSELGRVNIELSDGRVMTLMQTPSAGGARYTNSDESIIFWNKGNTVWLEENQSQTYTNCTEVQINTNNPINTNTENLINSNTKSEIPNPASEFCIKNGGKVEFKNSPLGQYGICFFDDGKACEEWAMQRGVCPIGGVKTTGYDNDAQKLCVWMGGQTTAEPNAQCTFQNGVVCSVDDLWNGKCKI